jgi:hypothetical protein
MPAQFEQVVGSFLTWFADEQLTMSVTWQISPGTVMLVLGPVLYCFCVRRIDGHILVFRRFHLVTKARIGFCMSVRPSACISAASTARISVNFDI